MKRIIALVVCAAICVACLASCSDDSASTAISLENGGKLSINFMYFLASIQKSMYSSVVQANGGNWDYVVDEENGTTLSDLLYNVTLDSAESLLICEYMHDEVYDLKLTQEQEKSVDNQISALSQSAGSKAKLEEQLSAYSSDLKTLERYLTVTLKQGNLYNYFYGENGIFPVAESDIQDYFANNYAIVTHIYFNTATKAKSDGTLVSLTDEEKLEKQQLAESVYNRILAGEDFYELKAQYSEDAYESEYYPNGFFVTNDTAFPTEFTVAALEMQPGEYRMVQSSTSSGSGIHIMYKLPMDESLYNTDSTVYLTIKNLLIADDFQARLDEYVDNIQVDEQIMAQLNINVVPEYSLS